jgi:diguanylate cyclase (GGDEF)-like protein
LASRSLSLRNFGFIVALWSVSSLAAAITAEQFSQRLADANRLNLSAPWPESQAVLDELRPHLELADHDQIVQFMMIESRNQAIDGRLHESLATVEELLTHDLDPAQRLSAHARAANVGYVAREFETTFRHLNAALGLLEDPALEPHAVNLYSVAAYIYVLLGEHDDAVNFGQKAVDIAHRTRPPRERCAAHQRLGFVYKRMGDVEAAEAQYRAGLDDCGESEDTLVTGTVEYGYGDLLQSIGRYEEASALLERAVATMEDQGYRSGLALARLYSARLALKRDDRERAESLLNAALPDLVQDGNSEYVAEVHRELANIAVQENRQADVIDHLFDSMAAREIYLQNVHDRRTAFLQVQFAVAETERELNQLREQQRIVELEQQSRDQQAQLRWIVGFATVVLVLILVIMLIRAVRDRRRYRRLSQRDALTALSNHTRFFELAETTLALARDKRRPFTLILADIDHFKAVNDRYGHPVGDRVLRHVGERLRDGLGKVGILGRVGGEEFGMALPGLSPEDAIGRIEQLRRDLIGIKADGVGIPVTMSFGIASARADESLADLRARADQRLYRAKHGGRDRIVSTDPAE